MKLRSKCIWVRRGFKVFNGFIKRPYQFIMPNKDGSWWHEHICLPLRFGPEVFERYCPFAKDNIDAEWDDRCDKCKYYSILEGENGSLRLSLDEKAIGKIWK